MAPPKDAVIEQALRRVTKDAAAKDGQITTRIVRDRVQKELGLEEGFFKNVNDWKQRSNDIISAAFAEQDEEQNKPSQPVQSAQPSKTKSQSSGPSQANGKKVAQTKAVPSKVNTSAKSEEQVEEDSSSDEEDSESEPHKSKNSELKKPDQPKQVNGVKRKAAEQSQSNENSASEDESSPDDSSDAQSPQKKARKDSSSSSEGNDSSEDGSGDDKESGDSAESQEDTMTGLSHTVAAIPAKAFVPPSGFTPIASELLTPNATFASSSLVGKQIWHIAAPSHLSLASIKEISLDALRSGQTVHSQDGIDYVLNEHSDSSSITSSMLVATEGGYQLVDQPIQRSLHLQQKISLPNLSIRQADQNAGSSAAAQVHAPSISHARPQPKGLRMRYKPPGSGSGKSGMLGTDSDEDEDVPTVNATTGLMQDVDAMDVDEQVVEEAPKKSKKKRKSKEVEETAQPVTNGVVNKTSTKLAQPPMPNGASEEPVSKEDRKRLKRERKEAKQKSNG